MATPLSDFTVSDVIGELEVNPAFELLTEAQQIALVNSAQQEISAWYNDAGKPAYEAETFVTSDFGVTDYFTDSEGAGTSQTIAAGSGNKVSKTILVPAGISAMEVQVKYTGANRYVKCRIYNSVDGTNFETTATDEQQVNDATQIIKFEAWYLSRYAKIEFEAFTAACTIEAKIRMQLR